MNPDCVAFDILGRQYPAGSKRAFVPKGGARAIVVDASGSNGKAWRTDVRDACRAAYSGPQLTEALRLDLVFIRQRPKCHYGRGDALRPGAPRHPTVMPDLTKLVRAVEDALTGLLWRDDKQVVQAVTAKRYGKEYLTKVLVTEAI